MKVPVLVAAFCWFLDVISWKEYIRTTSLKKAELGEPFRIDFCIKIFAKLLFVNEGSV